MKADSFHKSVSKKPSILEEPACNPLQILHDYSSNVKSDAPKKHSKDYSGQIKKNMFFRELLHLFPCAVYIFDYHDLSYQFVSEGSEAIAGYSPEEFFQKGTKLTWEKIHPDDMAFYSLRFFPKITETVKLMTKKEAMSCRFSINVRLKKKDGKYIHILQRFVFVEMDKLNNPLISLGIITDISDHKKDNTIHCSITKYDKKNGSAVIYKESCLPECESRFSTREIQVLKKIISGFSYTSIAKTLHVSPATIRAHRRNIMVKTKSKNTADLVRYAANNGLM